MKIIAKLMIEVILFNEMNMNSSIYVLVARRV
ncbi:hypothetical protein BH18THE2_BH18THE2_28170 [soil metagenome]